MLAGARSRTFLLGYATRAVAAVALVLVLAGCIPIGVRVQNMLGAAFGS